MYKPFVLFLLTLAVWMSSSLEMGIQSVDASTSESLTYDRSSQKLLDTQHQDLESSYFDESLDTLEEGMARHAMLLFQRDYALRASGLEESQTWAALGNASVSRDELDMLAKIIYGEARGESYEGQVAVGAVIMNRLASANFPDTVEEIITEPRAFTAIDDGQYRLKPDHRAYQAALDAVRGHDPTNSALYYFNPETATSSWIWTRKQVEKIGRHIFAV